MPFTAYQNRLQKNFRHWSKWARREGVSCYRLYDCDVPEVPVIVDWYEGQVHLQEVDTHWKQTEAEHQAWIAAVKRTTAPALGLTEAQIHFKFRRWRVGKEQHVKTEASRAPFIVNESVARFEVDLAAYLDTGLFLDHRPLRQRVLNMASGLRVLNLFAYTGSFSVMAALGKAQSVTTVDLSNTYLDWAKRNFVLNGLSLAAHEFIRQDVFAYLVEATLNKHRFDLIVCDPPSFSNSKKMLGVLDVSRDHPWLIARCLELLAPGGVCFFSTNSRGFKLDEAIISAGDFQEISGESVPPDFRNRKIHRAWKIQANDVTALTLGRWPLSRQQLRPPEEISGQQPPATHRRHTQPYRPKAPASAHSLADNNREIRRRLITGGLDAE